MKAAHYEVVGWSFLTDTSRSAPRDNRLLLDLPRPLDSQALVGDEIFYRPLWTRFALDSRHFIRGFFRNVHGRSPASPSGTDALFSGFPARRGDRVATGAGVGDGCWVESESGCVIQMINRKGEKIIEGPTYAKHV